MALRIAVAGKGGTGKSTIASLLCRSLVDRKVTPLLAVDADPNSCLAEKCGLTIDRTIGQLREELRKNPDKKPASISKSEWIERLIHESVSESTGMDMIVMGRQEGPSCYCYINDLLRHCMSSLSDQYRTVVIDNEAGMEHLSRRSNGKVEILLVVAEPNIVGGRTATRIMNLVKSLELEVGIAYLVLNRCDAKSRATLPSEFEQCGLETIANIPPDPMIVDFDVRADSLMKLPSESSALTAVKEMLDKLLERRQI
jgi:CO dehydrogenase maturation factor